MSPVACVFDRKSLSSPTANFEAHAVLGHGVVGDLHGYGSDRNQQAHTEAPLSGNLSCVFAHDTAAVIDIRSLHKKHARVEGDQIIEVEHCPVFQRNALYDPD